MAKRKSDPTPSQEFQEKVKFEEMKHKMKMEELKFMRESDRLHHEREMERQRIKTAEIRKSQLRKEMIPYSK